MTTTPTSPGVPTTISNLPAAAAITGSEFVAIVQNGVTCRSTTNAITGLISSIVAGNGITVSNLAGAVTISLSTPVSVANGGTGNIAYLIGDMLWASAGTTLTKFPGNTTNNKEYLSQTGSGSVPQTPVWAQIAAADLSNGTTGSGSVVLATSPSLTTPNIGAAIATSINFGGVGSLNTYSGIGAYTPTATGFTVVGTPAYNGTYIKIGQLVFVSIDIISSTSVASTAGTSTLTLPFPSNGTTVTTCVAASRISNLGLGTGIMNSSTNLVYPPTWSANAAVDVSFWYIAAS